MAELVVSRVDQRGGGRAVGERRWIREVIAIASSSLLVVASGCAYWGPPPPETPAPPWDEDGGEQEQGRYDPDVQIAMRLLEAFMRDRDVARGRVDVTVEDGVVTLLGTVDDPRARERALWLAERVHGVRAVHNRIDVEDRALDPLADPVDKH